MACTNTFQNHSCVPPAQAYMSHEPQRTALPEATRLYLQIALLTEVGTVFRVDLKSERGREELLELFGYTNGIGPVQRASPRLLGSLAGLLLRKGGMATLGRAMPLVAAPVSAYLNNQHIQRVGDSAIRHYDGWVHAHEKQRKAAGQ